MTAPVRLIVAFVLLALPEVSAQSGALPAQPGAAPQPAGPIVLMLRFPGGRTRFRPGETIPIELTFSSPVPRRFVVDGATYDRSGRLTIDEFHIEPQDAVRDPLLDYLASNVGYLGGGLRGMGTLGGKPYTVTLQLNEWLRFDTPGRYTLSVRSNRVTDETRRTGSTRPVVPVVSNVVTFDITPRDTAWEAAEVARAVQALDAPPRGVERESGCRPLRFLASNAAVDEMVRRYGDETCSFDFMAGLFSAPERDHAVRALEAGLRAPDVAITRSYLRTLAILSTYARHPELRPAQTSQTKGRLITAGEITRRTDLVQATETRYAELLAAALPSKTGAARAVTLAEQGRASQGQLAAAFVDLPELRQASLLESQWRSIAHPDMLPVLRTLAGTRGRVADLALRRLYELDPVDGRTRILREIQNPRRATSLKTLSLLPERELAQLDEALARHVEADPTDVDFGLLHRYASSAIAPRVLARFRDRVGTMACGPLSYLLAYILRAAPTDAATLLERALDSRARTGCYQSILRDTAALRMTPAVEAIAIARLEDPHPLVVLSASDTLGRFASPAALPSLRSHFEGWHRTWRGRERELGYDRTQGPGDQPGAMQEAVELGYVRAIGAAQGWLTSARELGELRALCVTDGCRAQTDHLTASARDTTITVHIFNGPDDIMARLAQYELRTLDALLQKLTQYPKGARLTLNVSAVDPQSASVVTAEVRRVAKTQGLDLP